MFSEFGHHQEQKTRRSGRVVVDCVALGTWAHALQIKRRVRWRPVLGRWWCAVLRLPLGLHSAALSADVVGRQHGMGSQV